MIETEIKKIIDDRRRDGTLSEWYWNIADTDNEFLIQVISYLNVDDAKIIGDVGGKTRSTNNLSKALENLIKKGCDEDVIIKIKDLIKVINANGIMEN